MNLEDVIDTEYGLQQDEFSTSGRTFGKDNQLSVIGWSGKNIGGRKIYIVSCGICSKDNELFGDGIFTIAKNNLVNRSATPCGCGSARWSKEQYSVLCRRRAEHLGCVSGV